MNTGFPDNLSTRRHKYIAVFLIILVSFFAYFNALQNNFVYDDEQEILGNPWIRDAKFISHIFLHHSWGFKFTNSTSHYHPLKFLINMAQFRLFGARPMGYHLANILVHAAVSVLVFFIAISLFEQAYNRFDTVLPASAALLFAVHPVHTEVVAWLAGISELFMSFFYMSAFFIYINASGRGYKKMILSAIFFLIAAFFKATAMTLPALLLSYDYSFKKGMFGSGEDGGRGDLIKRYAPFVLASAVYLALRSCAIGGFIPQRGHAGLTAYGIIINIFPLLSGYLEKLLLPLNLNAIHVFHPVSSLLETKVLTSLAVAVSFMSVIIISGKKKKGLFLGLLFIIIPLLPVLYLPAFTGESVFAERYLYLPSAGFVIALAFMMADIYRSKKLAVFTFSGLILISVLFVFITIERNNVWRKNISLWTDTVKKSPDSSVAHNNLGLAFQKENRSDEAIREYLTAIRLNPEYAEAYDNLGLAYEEQGYYEKAIEAYKIAVRLNPDFDMAHNDLGVVYLKVGRYEAAIWEFRTAIGLNPNLEEAYYNLALADLGLQSKP